MACTAHIKKMVLLLDKMLRLFSGIILGTRWKKFKAVGFLSMIYSHFFERK